MHLRRRCRLDPRARPRLASQRHVIRIAPEHPSRNIAQEEPVISQYRPPQLERRSRTNTSNSASKGRRCPLSRGKRARVRAGAPSAESGFETPNHPRTRTLTERSPLRPYSLACHVDCRSDRLSPPTTAHPKPAPPSPTRPAPPAATPATASRPSPWRQSVNTNGPVRSRSESRPHHLQVGADVRRKVCLVDVTSRSAFIRQGPALVARLISSRHVPST